ncbi:MAG: class I SAM-dependent methyltransferase [Eubacteriales bacterium]|nr:class I SAM-dependent methyltransferase [Eubacteriales bacterium]
MITKAQSKRYTPRLDPQEHTRLTALERGLLRWSTAEDGDKVLDAQAGGGRMLETLHRYTDCEICGLSDNMECVRVSRSRLRNADIVYGSHEDIPWREDTFDSVFIKMVSAPLSERALSEALRVLKPGGQMLVGLRTLPAPIRQIAMWFRNDADEEPMHRRECRQMMAMMRRMGIKQITRQPTDMFNCVCIGWKPLPPEREWP